MARYSIGSCVHSIRGVVTVTCSFFGTTDEHSTEEEESSGMGFVVKVWRV